ncbi:DeoR/GlpR family DNA-binding transcription regulator [Aerococcus urinaeequi]|uniref:Lactose phosphotransferase system repressor n=1 Tax=Aerococcus viridans TaxID=1377 RepID=A0A2N6UCB2_9LACT|nr:DeoR/GlpR family DNA-binding transcription regulator [Aerococcus viridans]PMC79200.1 DeoR/GlpR transcriptional regulator [Aerococcus viridans]
MKRNRHKKITSLIEDSGYLSVQELAKLLSVSEMTVRRDLKELDEKKILVKEHGGAKKIQDVLSTDQKMPKNIKEKMYLGGIINSVISPGDVIFIGAGTTLYYALPSITQNYKCILTNSLLSFNYLVENGYSNIVLTGGEYFSLTGEFVGTHAEEIFDLYNVDVAFISTNGIHDRNITTSYPSLGRIQHQIINCSKKTYVVADNSKFNKSDIFTFATLDEVTGIISDNNISDDVLNKYSKFGKIITTKEK